MKKLCLALLAAFGGIAHASGGDGPLLEPFPSTAPSIALHDFGAGHLGIVDGSFQRAYLVAAWRAIGGQPLTAAQAQQLSLALSDSSGGWTVGRGADGKSPWEDARKRFGPKQAPGDSGGWIERSREVQRTSAAGTERLNYDNCSDDAGRVAAATLTQRATAHGDADHDPWVAEWLRGQDVVFRDCNYADDLPTPAPADAPAWFKQDRAYQAAAAQFYIGAFDKARAGFAAIAADPASPWSTIAPYLVARSDLRIASLSTDAAVKKPAIARAESEFRALAIGPNAALHAPARAMLRRVDIERDRRAALLRIGREVGDGAWGADASAQIGDLLSLVRQPVRERSGESRGVMESSPASGAQQRSDPDHTVAPRDGSLVDWLAAMNQAQYVAPESGGYVYYAAKPPEPDERARWCGQLSMSGAHRSAWMTACYLSAKTSSDIPLPVRDAASALPDTAPAWATITYLDLVLQMRERDARTTPMADAETQALRARFDAAIAMGDAVFGADGINALRILRAPLSTSTLDFVVTSRIREIGEPALYAWHDEVARKPYGTASTYSTESALLTTSVDIRQLAELSTDAAAPDDVRADALRAAWTRAAVLRQDAVVAQLTPALLKREAAQAGAIHGYLDATDPVEKQFQLASLIHQHGFSPTWAGYKDADTSYNDPAWSCKYPTTHASLAWMDAADVAAAQAELAALAKLPTSNVYYGEAVLALAKKSPADPRLPDALATAVASTRMACAGETPVSKAAFQALHKLFPKSTQARDTKYFF